MKPTSPVIVGDEGLPEVRVAEHQPQYLTLPAVYMYFGRCAVSRWIMTDEERKDLAETGELRFYMWTMGAEPQHSLLTVTAPDPADEPNPREWEYVEHPKENEVSFARWKLDGLERQMAVEAGHVYLLVWNEHGPLMPVDLQVQETVHEAGAWMGD
jgi:hypothetical protein